MRCCGRLTVCIEGFRVCFRKHYLFHTFLCSLDVAVGTLRVINYLIQK
jgi:hypothetical protein